VPLALAPTPELAERYLGRAPSALYLVRPDHHVAARWQAAGGPTIAAALARARGV
jgi:3-(3-hydroxy-phenyl)propionate hydroxylase